VLVLSDSTDDKTLQKEKDGLSIKKGDEVKFNVGIEKNGKRIAMNVQALPKGTIPSQAEKHACRGYILVEPSHTEIAKTQLRGNSRARAGAGTGAGASR